MRVKIIETAEEYNRRQQSNIIRCPECGMQVFFGTKTTTRKGLFGGYVTVEQYTCDCGCTFQVEE